MAWRVFPFDTDQQFAAAAVTTSDPDWYGQTVRIAEVTPGTIVPASLGFAIAASGTAFAINAPSGITAANSKYRLLTAALAAATGSVLHFSTPEYWLGSSAGLGGFKVSFVISVPGGKAASRFAVGLFTGAAAIPIIATEPSAFAATLDFACLGADSTDANLQIIYGTTGTGIATKVNLGASFPKATAGAVYRVTLTATAAATVITYLVERLDVAASITGTMSGANLPANIFFMSPQVGFSGGTGAGTAQWGWMRTIAVGPY